MSDQQFDILFRGDIVLGHKVADVKTRLQQLFKADAAKIDALFSGRPVPLKRGLDFASAQKYKDALNNAGAQVDIVAVGESRPAVAPVAEVAPKAPLTLAERLAQQEAAAKLEEEASAAREALKAEQKLKDSMVSASANAQPSWTLSPVGADLLKEGEKQTHAAREIDISSISLRPEGGNILDANEQPRAQVAKVVVPQLEVAEIGADLISPDEKMKLPLLEIELEDWTLAGLGEDLIAESERPAVKTADIAIPDVGLAPVGADLGQMKPQIQKVNPDISGLRLAD